MLRSTHSMNENKVSMLPSTSLPATYYVDNFFKLLTHVESYYMDLLNGDEVHWLQRFKSLTKNSQCLLVRMLTRKGEWFRSDKLYYDEIGEPSKWLQELAGCGFVAINQTMQADILAQELLTKPELIRTYPFISPRLKKSEQILALSQYDISAKPSLNFDVIQLLDANHYRLMCQLFFGNGRQDLSQFVLADLGLQNFEDYVLTSSIRYFKCRDDVDTALLLSKLYDHYYQSKLNPVETLHQLIALLPDVKTHHDLERRRQKLINLIARDFERHSHAFDALALYDKTTQPPSRERRVRLHLALNTPEKSWPIITSMLNSPLDIEEYEVALRLKPKIQKALSLPQDKRVIMCPPTRHLEMDLTKASVELAVKQYMESEGWEVFYLENHFLNTLFGLCFWDIIFSPVDGVFINAYQQQPLDLYQPDFSSRRRRLLDERLNVIECSGVTPFLCLADSKRGISNPFVYWPYVDERWLKLVEQAIDGRLLRQLFTVMLKDLKKFRTGMPDLIAFKDGQFMWCEVKGPGDKLQGNQKRWMQEYEQLGVAYQVCYVTHME